MSIVDDMHLFIVINVVLSVLLWHSYVSYVTNQMFKV